MLYVMLKNPSAAPTPYSSRRSYVYSLPREQQLGIYIYEACDYQADAPTNGLVLYVYTCTVHIPIIERDHIARVRSREPWIII